MGEFTDELEEKIRRNRGGLDTKRIMRRPRRVAMDRICEGLNLGFEAVLDPGISPERRRELVTANPDELRRVAERQQAKHRVLQILVPVAIIAAIAGDVALILAIRKSDDTLAAPAVPAPLHSGCPTVQRGENLLVDRKCLDSLPHSEMHEPHRSHREYFIAETPHRNRSLFDQVIKRR